MRVVVTGARGQAALSLRERARRPTDSRLGCGKRIERYAVARPDWRESVKFCVARPLQPETKG
jgi:dTDP-4-dehydrorhamnose reductase